MTAISDATTAELDDNDLVTVPRDEWDAMQDRIEDIEDLEANIKRGDERLNELEARKDRYEILRDVVATLTDLEANTLDRLVEQRREDEGQ